MKLHSALAVCVALCATAVHAQDFKLVSSDIQANELIPRQFEFSGFGCQGTNRSPALSWNGAPADTRSYAVTVYDPDAPTGSGWWHWLVVNIPARVSALPQDAGHVAGANLPPGARQVRNDFGVPAWGGVCPPPGERAHRYVFTVHALKVEKIDLPADATAALAGYMINANTIGKARFVARYARQ